MSVAHALVIPSIMVVVILSVTSYIYLIYPKEWDRVHVHHHISIDASFKWTVLVYNRTKVKGRLGFLCMAQV